MTDTASSASALPDDALIHPLQQLSNIDRLLLARQYVEAGNGVIALLEELGGSKWVVRDYGRADNHGERLNTYAEVAERAGNQWRQVLLSGCDLTRLDLMRLVQNIYQLHLILMGSFQGHMDDVILAQHQTHGENYTPERVLRLLLAWCPASRLGIDIFQQYPNAPELVLAHAMATVGGMALVSEVANAARNRAIELMNDNDRISDEVLSKFDLTHNLVMGCWMRCSYSEHPQKHRVKALLMRISRLWLQAQYGAMPTPEAVPLKHQPNDKPLLVVPLESFGASHAMYRCYAPILEYLREDFYLVGIAAKGYFDDATEALFDEFFDVVDFYLDGPMNLTRLETAIASWQPAALYYPSLGMVDWVQQLSQKRLAPVQLMTLGHPASSQSPVMDYALIDQDLLGAQQQEVQQCFSEKVIAVPAGVSGFRLPPHATRVAPLQGLPEDGIIRIAIPSVAQKLSAGFVRSLQRLEEACPGRVHFVFFLGERSLQSVACLHQVRRELKSVEFHLQLSYDDYISEINRCQLHACSFPFGGTNSLVDSLRQGIPLLALEGIEPHARVDAAFIRYVGLPTEQICHSEEEYQRRLISLVQQPEELARMKHYLLHEAEVDRVLLQDGHPEYYRDTILSLLKQELPA